MKKIALPTFLLYFFCNGVLFAQDETPVNSNYLSHYRISPKVLDAAADMLLQDGSFLENLNLTITTEEGNREYKLMVDYDPKYKYGKDIRFIIDPSDFTEKDIKKFKQNIEKSHQYSRLSRRYLFDESTLKLVKNSENEIVLEYFYQKNNLEVGLEKIKRLKGQIFIIQGQLERVVVTGFKPLKGKKTNYKQTTYFKPIEDRGGHIISRVVEKYTVEKGKQPVHYTFEYTTSAYESSEGEQLVWEGKKDVKPLFEESTKTDTVSVSLGGVLPIFGKPSTKLGYGLPRPVGINLVKHQQVTNLEFTDLQVGFNNGELSSLKGLFDLDNSAVLQSVDMYMVRADVWVFPFLNLYGLIGAGSAQINGGLTLDQELRETLSALAPILGLNPEDIPNSLPINLDVAVTTYGVGATLAVPLGEHLMLTGNYQFVVANTPDVNASTISHIFMPLLGYRTKFDFSIMVGAMGQFYDTDITGFADIDDGSVLNYNVAFEPRVWNGMVAAYKGFGKHWNIVLNVGFGERESTTAILGYRF